MMEDIRNHEGGANAAAPKQYMIQRNTAQTNSYRGNSVGTHAHAQLLEERAAGNQNLAQGVQSHLEDNLQSKEMNVC